METNSMNDVLAQIELNQFVTIQYEGNDVIAKVGDLSILTKFCEAPDWVHVCGMTSRVGYAYFQRYLELKYFPPLDDELNKLIQVFYLKFGDESMSMPYCMTSVPAEFLTQVNEAIDIAGLRVTEPGTVPMLLGGEGTTETFLGIGANKFPIEGPNVFYVENKHNHLVYTDPQKAHEEEDQKLRELEERYIPEEHRRKE
jgi:hypothetical protein